MSKNKDNLVILQTKAEEIKDAQLTVGYEGNNETITQTTEKTSNNSIPVNVVQSMVQYFVTNMTRCSQMLMDNTTLTSDKLSNMFTFINLEGKTIELMLENKYYTDERGKKAYAQIKEVAMTSTLNGIGKLTDTTNLKLLDELESSRKEVAELKEAVNQGKQREAELQEDIKLAREKATRYNSQANMAIEGLRSYTKLTDWYETMIAEMKNDEDTKVKWYQTYNWRGGMKLHALNNPKPKVEKFTF